MTTKSLTKSAKVTKKTSQKLTLAKVFPWLLVIGGILGVLSAAILTIDKFKLLENPHTQLNCNLNPIIACGPVINTDQASAFGFPNPIIGLVGFGVVITVGMALLAGADFKRWFWRGLQLGTLFGVGFVTWLQYQTIFNINALCPYCMVVWCVTIPIFWYTLLYNLKNGHIVMPARLAKLEPFMQKHHADVLVVWFLAIILVIGHHFWYYWSTLI